MRQIKLRAWDKHFKKMVNLSSINFALKIATVYPKGSTSPHDIYQTSLDELDLMQFTGFTDSAGREIYEGDILDNGADLLTVELDNFGGVCGKCSRVDKPVLICIGAFADKTGQIKSVRIAGNIYEGVKQ